MLTFYAALTIAAVFCVVAVNVYLFIFCAD